MPIQRTKFFPVPDLLVSVQHVTYAPHGSPHTSPRPIPPRARRRMPFQTISELGLPWFPELLSVGNQDKLGSAQRGECRPRLRMKSAAIPSKHVCKMPLRIEAIACKQIPWFPELLSARGDLGRARGEGAREHIYIRAQKYLCIKANQVGGTQL